MADNIEVVITSEATGQLWTACVWDPRAGTTLMTYKGSAAAPRSLCLLGRDYLLSAEPDKPLLHAWALNKHEQVQLRMVCPGRISALACSPDGSWCAAGIAEKLHIWQVTTGLPVAVASRHFQPISCLAFTDEGSHLVSGGEDGQVLVWSMLHLLAKGGLDTEVAEGSTNPKYTFSHHSLTVRDIFIGNGGIRAHMASVSMDKSCKLYDLATGRLLLTIVFDHGLTSVTMDHIAAEVFVGAANGSIISYNLRNPPRTPEFHISEEHQSIYSSHEKAVVSLSVSSDNITLVSGALDEQVIIWHIPSRQVLRTLPHKGAISNAFFATAPRNIFSEDLKPSIILQAFRRQLGDGEKHTIEVFTNEEKLTDRERPLLISKCNESRSEGDDKREIARLLKINKELYEFAAAKLLQPQEVSTGLSPVNGSNKISPVNGSNQISPVRGNKLLQHIDTSLDTPLDEGSKSMRIPESSGSKSKKKRKRNV